MKMKWNRFLALALAVIMVIGMVPVPAHALSEGETLYLKPGDWETGGAWYVAWAWGASDSKDAWLYFTDEDADGVYETELTASYTQLKFLRMASGATEPSWTQGDNGYWDQTDDLTISGNCCTLSGWTSANWSTYTPTTPTYYVPGDEALTGEGWIPSANPMADADGDGTYEKVFTNIAAGTYKYKIAVNSTWDVTWSNGSANDTDGNSAVTVDTDGSTVTITFTPSTKAVSATVCAHTNTTTTTTATCITAGTKTVTCNDCGATVSTEADPATGVHTYENGFCTGCERPEYIYVTFPDMEYLGVELYDEERVKITTEPERVTNETFGESYIKVALPSDAAYILATWYGSGSTPMTKITAGKNMFEVSSVSYPDLDCTWGTYCAHADCHEVTYAANCTDAGSTTYTCKNESCKKTITVTIPANGHNFVDGKCSVCHIPQVIYVDCGDYGPYGYNSFGYSLTDASSITIGDEEHVRDNVYKITLGKTAKEIRFWSSAYFDNTYYSIWYDIAKQTTGENAGNDLFTATGKNIDDDYHYVLTGEWGKYCPHTDKTTSTTESSCLTKGAEIVTCNACQEVVSTTKLDMLGHDWTNSDTCTRADCNVPHYFYVDFGYYYEDCTYEAEVYNCYNPEGTDPDSGFNYETCESEQVTGAVFKFTVPKYAAADNTYGGDAISLEAMSEDLEGYFQTWDTNFDSTGKILYSTSSRAWIECPHTYGTTKEVTLAATCITAGTEINKCVVCGAQVGEPETIPPTSEHVYDEDGNCTADPKCTATKPYVAQIGEDKYETLTEAIAYAKETDGTDTIKLLDDIVTESLITIDTPVKLELDDHSITREGTTDGSVTVYVTSEGVQILRGSIVNTGRGIGIYVVAGASAYLYDMNVTGVDYGIYLAGGETYEDGDLASVELSSNKSDGKSTVTSDNIGIAATGCSYVNVVMGVVSGGNVGIYADGAAMVTVQSTSTVKGTLESASATGDGIRAYGNAYVNVTGGTVSGSASGTGIELYQSAEALVYGNEGETATVNGESGICVYGGRLTVKKGAAIDGTDVAICTGSDMADESTNDEYIKSVSITITGGNFTGGNGVIETRPASTAYVDRISISGGTFSHPVEKEYCADGYVPSGNDTDGYGVKTATVILDAIEAAYDSEIQLWMKVYIADTLLEQENAYIEMTKAGGYGNETVKITMADLRQQTKDDEGRYKLAMGIASGEMTCGVTYKIVDGEGNAVDLVTGSGADKGTVATFSVMDYVQLIMANGSDAQKEMVKALVTYGGYAQVHFDVETDNLAYGETAPELADVNITESSAVYGDNIGVAATSMQAFLDSAIYLRVYFTMDDGMSIDNYTFTLGDTQLTPVAQNGRYYVDILDIPAAYLDKMYTITVTNGTGTYTVTTSVLVWIKNMLNETSITEAHRNLLKAMYWYNQEANEFFPGY